MSNHNPGISITVEFNDQEAWDLAQFFKRAGFRDYRSNAIDDAEAYRMQDAAEKVRRALRDNGYAPR